MQDKTPLAHYSGVLSEAVHEIAAANLPTFGAAALSEYLKTCEQHAIVPDVGGAFASAFTAGFNLAASQAAPAAAPVLDLESLTMPKNPHSAAGDPERHIAWAMGAGAVFATVESALAATPAAAPVVLPEPVGWRHSRTLTLHETEQEVQLADGDSHAEPLFTEEQLRALLATATGLPAQAVEQAPVLYVSKEQLDSHTDHADSEAGRYLPCRITPAGKFITPLFAVPHSQEFQQRVQPWMMACFGPEISADRSERNHRFLEEALELVQSCGCTASEAHQLVDYVYSRPWGEPAQEAGGVMVTLAALCLANGLDMHECGETELARIWTKVEAIRAKQAAKPKHSPLPMQAPQTQDGLRLAFVLSEIRRDGMDALSAALHDLDGFPLDHQASVEAIDRAAIAAAKGE